MAVVIIFTMISQWPMVDVSGVMKKMMTNVTYVEVLLDIVGGVVICVLVFIVSLSLNKLEENKKKSNGRPYFVWAQ